MPDQWGRPEMSDWMGMTQAINTFSSIRDKSEERRDTQGVEAAMGNISRQQKAGTALGDIERPDIYTEKQWMAAILGKHKLNEAAYSEWHHDFQKNKDSAFKGLAGEKLKKQNNVPENQRKEAIFDFYNKHVWDNQRYLGTEKKEDGSVVHKIENVITGQVIEQPDKTADEMLWAAEDYLNRWYDKTAPVARAQRVKSNIEAFNNPTEYVNESGDKITLYFPVKRENDGYEKTVVMKDPTGEQDFVETSVEKWVAQGYKPIPKATPENAIAMAGKKSDQIRKSMNFIAKQLGVVPDKKSSDDDIMDLARGENQGDADMSAMSTALGENQGDAEKQGVADMPAMSTLKGILGKMEGGSPEEKELAKAWMQMAAQLYPGLKNMPDTDQGQGSDKGQGGEGKHIPAIDDDFILNPNDSAEIAQSVQAGKESRLSEESRKVDEQLPGLSESLNKYNPQQDTAVNMPPEEPMPRRGHPVISKNQDSRPKDSIEIDRQLPGFSEGINRYRPQPHPALGGPQAPHENLPAPFQHNPDQVALNMIRDNRPRR